MLLKVPFHGLPDLCASMWVHPGRHRVHTSGDFTAFVLTGAPPVAFMIFSATGETISFPHLEDKVVPPQTVLLLNFVLCSLFFLQYCACSLALQAANAVFAEGRGEEGPGRILRKRSLPSVGCA